MPDATLTAVRSENARDKFQPVFDQLKPMGLVESMAGLIPTDLHDLIMGHHALRSWPVSGEKWGIPDVVVIWYPHAAVCVPWDDFMRDYRCMEKPP